MGRIQANKRSNNSPSPRYISRRVFLLFALAIQTAVFAQVKVGESFPLWTSGYLDIHHIHTGRGESVFAILPDGTTMLIDAGDVNLSTDGSNDRIAGERIVDYISHMMDALPEKRLDYIFLTHFHPDHMGDVRNGLNTSSVGNYVRSGITEVGDQIPFKIIVDRSWPYYKELRPIAEEDNISNYIKFVRWQVDNGATAERFEVGSNSQFKLRYDADKYPEFEIRNLAANGQVWTGVQHEVYDLVPSKDVMTDDEYAGEDLLSAAIRISYGKFDYLHGSDISHVAPKGTWGDVETVVGLAVGPVEVSKANNHGSHGTMGEAFLKAVRPKVVIIQNWAADQPDHRVLQRMMDRSLYPGERDIFATNLLEATRIVLGRRAAQMKSQRGHVVTRVHPGGEFYDIYILDEVDHFTVKAIHGPYESR